MSRNHSSVALTALLLSAVVLLGGRRAEAVSETGLAQGLGHRIAFSTLDQGPCGPWRSAMVRLFSSEAEWDAVMAELADQNLVDMAPVSAPRGVDWSHQAVVLVTMGELSSRGYSLDVSAVNRSGALCVVDVECSAPSRRSWGFCRPYQVILVEKHGLNRIQGRFRWVDAGAASADVSISELTPEPGAVRRLSWGALKAGAY
jgi:hypothetical protein